MPITLYDATVPVFLRGLDRIGAILEIGRAHAEAQGIDPADLLAARLAPDMLTLTGQVQRASDTAKFAAVRIGGVETVTFADDEMSFAALADRVARTKAFLNAVPRSAIDDQDAAMLSVTIGRSPVTIGAADYALQFALPNFFFHVTTAYAILRHCGVPLGKMDYIGRFSG